MKGHNGMILYVEEYFNKKMLAKLGYRFSVDELTVADVEAFQIIQEAINKNEADSMKKAKGRRHGRIN